MAVFKALAASGRDRVTTFTPSGLAEASAFSVFTITIPPFLRPWNTFTSRIRVLSCTMM